MELQKLGANARKAKDISRPDTLTWIFCPQSFGWWTQGTGKAVCVMKVKDHIRSQKKVALSSTVVPRKGEGNHEAGVDFSRKGVAPL